MTDCRTSRDVLAEGPICRVEQCDCGTVHLSIGPLSVRLHHDALTSLWTTLGEAVHRLSARRDSHREAPYPAMPS